MKSVTLPILPAALAVGIGVLPGIGADSVSIAQEADTIRISIYQPRGLGCAPLLIAEENGYFEEERISFDPLFVQNGPQVVQHMAAGDLDIGCGAITVWMIGKSKGVDIKAVISTAKGNAPLVVQPGITSIGDLDGKRCGTPGLGTIHDDNLSAFERKNGISVEHVHGVGMASVVAMFDKGEIDCMTGWEPLMAAASVRGEAEYLVDFMRPDSMESIQYAVMSQFAEEQPDVVYRFVRALLKGSRFIKEKPDEATNILSTATGFEREVVVRALKRTVATEPVIDTDGAKVALADAMAGGKIASSDVTDSDAFINDLVDHSFLEKADRALKEEGWQP